MKFILNAEDIKISIKNKNIIKSFSYSFGQAKIYSIIGPNGSGKTTLLRALSRNLKPSSGDVKLYGKSIYKQNTKEVAKKLAVLSQVHSSMTDIKVRDLVSYGRYSHRAWWKGNNSNDIDMIEWAIEKTGMKKFENRKINTLSGGERQRAWIAMAIAQKPNVLLLDEPTTFLDIGHQLELLKLIYKLNREEKITIIMVLHDLNQAVHYSDELLIIKDGELVKDGSPWEMLEENVFEKIFNVKGSITKDKETGKPIFFPLDVINN